MSRTHLWNGLRLAIYKVQGLRGRRLLAILLILGLATVGVVGIIKPTTTHAAGTFTNPIGPKPDPFMTYYNGQYYLVEVNGDNTLRMRSAASIGSLYNATPQIIWTENDPSRNQDVWAPSFFSFNDHWYVYWTGDDGNVSNHRMQVLESDGLLSQGATPNGSYHFKSTLNDPANNVLGIDGIPFVHNNQMYFVWAAGYCCGFDTLRLSTMSDPFTLSGTSVALNVDSCEGVAEAPSTIHRNGRTWLVYSVCDTGKPEYQLKMQSINDGADPMNPNNWQDWGTVFQSNPDAGVWSVGSNGFFQSPDGTQDWIVYQGKDTDASGNDTYSHRTTRAQQFTWNGDGSPNFGSPVGLGVPIAVPSGDPGTDGGATGQINAPGGKCVDVAGANSTSGTIVQMWDCNGTNAQAWTVTSNGTLQALGKCLDIDGDGTAAGTKVELWDCNGVGGQQWVPQSNGSLLNPQSGRCLDDPAGNTANGTQLQIWDCNNQWPQVFHLP